MASSVSSLDRTEGLSMRAVPIGVFWDIENCSVPRGKSALSLVQRVRDLFFCGHREVEFMCVCDTSKENKDIIQELNYAQVTVVHIHATSKNAADDKLRQSLRRFANAYPSPATSVLLSGDVNFASELSDLRYRHHHHVILIHPSHTQEALLNCAHECHLFEEIFTDLPIRTANKSQDGNTELLVSGLPRNRPPRVVQQRLRQLSDNCGGRVVNVSRSSALIKFASVDTTNRAKKRLSGEDVFGTKITVDYAMSPVALTPETEALVPAPEHPQHDQINQNEWEGQVQTSGGSTLQQLTTDGHLSTRIQHVLAKLPTGNSSPPAQHRDTVSHQNMSPLLNRQTQIIAQDMHLDHGRTQSLSPKYFRPRSWSRSRCAHSNRTSPDQGIAVNTPLSSMGSHTQQAARCRKSKSCESRSSQSHNGGGDAGQSRGGHVEVGTFPLDIVPQRDFGMGDAAPSNKRTVVKFASFETQISTSGSRNISPKKVRKNKNRNALQADTTKQASSNPEPEVPVKLHVNPPFEEPALGLQMPINELTTGVSSEIMHPEKDACGSPSDSRSKVETFPEGKAGPDPVLSQDSPKKVSSKTPRRRRHRKRSTSEKRPIKSPNHTAQKLRAPGTEDQEVNNSSREGKPPDQGPHPDHPNAGAGTVPIVTTNSMAIEDQSIIYMKRYDEEPGKSPNSSSVMEDNGARAQQHSPDVIIEDVTCSADVSDRQKEPCNGTGARRKIHTEQSTEQQGRNINKVRSMCFKPSSPSKKSGEWKPKQIPQSKVSPPKVYKPRAMRPKYHQSPGKYYNGYDNYQNQYATVPYQYATPPAIHKFNHYRYTTWGDYGGYYSQFGYAQQQNDGNEGNEIREVVDKYTRNRKMSREVLFMQQQIYHEDKWDKDGAGGDVDGDLDEDILLQEDVDVFCREECHSAPPLPFPHSLQSPSDRVRHNSMSPGYPRHSPNFRRTPGASRPNSRQSNYSGGGGNSRPGSSMSMRSNSSYGSNYNSAYHNEGNHFLPVHRTSPLLSISDLGEDGVSESVDVESDLVHVELMVSNLDYNISAREWKKILYAEFHQHVQVIDVYIQTQPDNTNIGYIKVPDVDDARFAISQFHRKKIGYKRIHVTLVNQDEAAAANTKTDVVAILQEVPSHQLSLYKLMELYEKRFKTPVTVSEIYGFQDVLKIWELEGQGRVVKLLPSVIEQQTGEHVEEMPKDTYSSPLCPIHCPEGSSAFQDAMESSIVVFVTLQLKSFSAQVHTLIQSHEDCLPLASLPTCYGCEFGHLPTVSHGGIPLEHLISCVPGVKIAVTPSGIKNIQWAENKPPPPIENGRFCPSPLLNQQLLQFSREVVELLKHSPQCRLPFNKFIPTYHHTLGRQCRVADYGYTKLMELFDAIPHVVQVIGIGNRKYVTLTHRAQMKRFAMDILRVLKSQASKQISVLDLSVVYNKVFAKPFDLTEYGLSYLEDILSELPENTISVSGCAEEMVLSIPRRDQTNEEVDMTKQFALEVIDLLKHSPQSRMPFHRFIPAYHHHFGKQCRVSDYGFTKLVELFEAIPHVLKVVDEQEDKVLTLVESELLMVLEEQVAALLKSCPDHKLPVPEFLSSYTKFHFQSLRLQDYGVTSVMELMDKIQRIAQVESREGKYVIKLVDRSMVQMLAHRILLLLMDQVDGSMELEQLQQRYKQLFGYSFTESEVKRDLSELVQVTTTGGKSFVKLCPLQMFARDVRSLLRHHNGKLALGQFEAAYASHFGVHLVPASYGYPSATGLLQAITHVAQLRGKGPNRTVLLCQDFQGKLMTSCSTRVERATSPLETGEEDAGQASLGTDLMSHAVARRSPCDLLSSTVPSGVPSPELTPSTALPPGDLMRFDAAPISVQDFFDSLSPKEKKGQRTPLCKTPVSEMLQFAAQLLPTDDGQPSTTVPDNQNIQYLQPYPQYSQANQGYVTEIPPVPTDAPHVAMLEQQLNPHGLPEGQNDYACRSPLAFQYLYEQGLSEYNRPTVFDCPPPRAHDSYQMSNMSQEPRAFSAEYGHHNGNVHNSNDRRLLSMLQGAHKPSDRPRAYLSNQDESQDPPHPNQQGNYYEDPPDEKLADNCVPTAANDHISDPVKYGGTMFWRKTESMGMDGFGGSSANAFADTRMSPAGCEAPMPGPIPPPSTSKMPAIKQEQPTYSAFPVMSPGKIDVTKPPPPIDMARSTNTSSIATVVSVPELAAHTFASHTQPAVPSYELITPAALSRPGKLAYSTVVAQCPAQKPASKPMPQAAGNEAPTVQSAMSVESLTVKQEVPSPKQSHKAKLGVEVVPELASSPTAHSVPPSDQPSKRRVSGSSLIDEDVTDVSVTSSPSPSRRQGTPRKSRIAAKFSSSPVSQS